MDAYALHGLGISYLQIGNRTAAVEVESQLRLIDAATANELARLIKMATLENKGAEDGWVLVGRDKTDASYANPSTIRRNGALVKMWDITDFKKAQVGNKSVKPYKSTKGQNEYDCEEERLRSLSSSWHSENMGRGNVVFSIHEPLEWVAVSPDSRGRRLWSVACGKP